MSDERQFYRRLEEVDRHMGGPEAEEFDPDDFDMGQADDHIAKMADHIEHLHEMGKIDVHRILAESLFHDEQQTHDEGAMSREPIYHMVRKAMRPPSARDIKRGMGGPPSPTRAPGGGR
jgi:hypothetical protein